ncbi:MAG: thioredoxin fold domain-containing protein [Alphaproteobacteria bacterium]|nr:thioredoxin fold domain-containing protein [Alphaproteobacteria bacterium]
MMRLFLALFLVLFAHSSMAAPDDKIAVGAKPPLETPAPPVFNAKTPAPDISKIKVIADLSKKGAKTYYLGERAGIFGWLVSLNNHTQVIYAPADGSFAMVGALFTGDGNSVSGPQINALIASNKEVAELYNNASKRVSENAAATSLGEKLIQEMGAASGVVFGRMEAGRLNVVVSTDCPACHDMWKDIKGPVAEGKVQVKFIPIANTGTEEERQAAQLLKSENPLEAWDKHVSGDKTALAGAADSSYLKSIRDNLTVVDRWNIGATPYIVYRSKDGRVMIVSGRPEKDKLAAILADLSR